MSFKVTNNARTTLAANIGVNALNIVINSGDAALFPSPGQGEWFPLTLYDAANLEIVHVTKRNGGILTVKRGREGTTARAWNIGTRADLRLTAAVISEIGDGFLKKTGGVMTGEINARGSIGLRLSPNNGTPAAVLHKNNSHFHILLTDAGNRDGDFNDLRPFQINLTSGKVSMSCGFNVLSGESYFAEKAIFNGGGYFGGTLKAGGEIQSTSINSIRFVWGENSPSVITRKDGSNFYFLLTAPNDPLGGYNALRPLHINLTTGRVSMSEGLTVKGGVILTDGSLKIGGAYYYPSVAITGDDWKDWHASGNAKVAINSRIEARATAIATAIAAGASPAQLVTDTRYAGLVQVYDTSLPSGYVATGSKISYVNIGQGMSEKRINLRGRQLQIHIAGVGWRAAGTWDPNQNPPTTPGNNP